MRRFIVLIVLLGIPTLAQGKDWYVSPSGSGTTCSSGSPCALSTGNDSVKAGDRVILQSGTYSTTVAPARSGNSIASRITYMSATLSPSSVTITPDISLTKSYVSIKGVTCTGELAVPVNVGGASYDSIHACVLNGGFSLFDSDHCMISQNTIGGQKFRVRSTYDGDDTTKVTSPPWHWCESDSVYDNNMSTVTSENANIMMEFRAVRNLMFVRNHCTMVSHAGPAVSAGGSGGIKQFYVQDSKFLDNYWSVTTDCSPSGGAGCDEPGYCVIRDFSYRNLYLRDTLLVGSNGEGALIRLNHAGHTPHREFNNNFESCFFKNTSGNIEYQEGIEADTLLNNVFVAYGNALTNFATYDTSDHSTALIDHNTFVSLKPYRTEFGAFALVNADDSWHGDLIVRNNIMYSIDTGDTITIIDEGTPRVVNGPYGAAVYRGALYTDWFNGKLTLDHNLYWCGSMAPIAEWAGSSNYTREDPSDWHANQPDFDEHSTKGNPKFADTTITNFSFQLLPGSAAIDVSWPDGYVGADGYAPDAVGDLTLGHGKNTITVSWTAPGDDGSSGQARRYDLRMSTSAINNGNFGGATPITVPTPSAAGTPECVTVSGLVQCTTYYFAIKTIDDMNNVSLISNCPSTTTNCSGSSQVTCGDGLMAGGGDDVEREAMIQAFELTFVSSNPASDRATLRCAIPQQGAGSALDLGVFDLAGRKIRSLRKSSAEPGIQMITWDLRDGHGRRVRPGLYFVRGRNGSSQITRTLVVE